jgi:hydrogenase maturation protease
MPKTLILGIGNLLMGDEGAGIQVLRYLREISQPRGVDFVDGGTGGLNLLGFFLDYDRIILIDAVVDDQPPGTVSVVYPEYPSDYPATLVSHDIGLKDLIAAAYLLERTPETLMVTISIREPTEVTLDLSPEVSAAIPAGAQSVLDELASTQISE